MSEGDAAADKAPQPVAVVRLGLSVPAPAEFEALVASQETLEGLRGLRQAVAAWQVVAEKCDHAFEVVVKLSTYRLRVERALGVRLTQEVKHGGPRPRSPGGTLVGGLPDGVTKQQAAKYRQLAAVSDLLFDAYLEVSSERHKLPTSSGARRFAAPRQQHEPVVRKPRRVPHKSLLRGGVHPTVVDIVERIMSPDVVVGPPAIPSRVRVGPNDSNPMARIKGDVLVLECTDAAKWLSQLTKLHRGGVVRQAVVAVVADVWAEWFQQALVNGWVFCLVCGPSDAYPDGVVLAHIGGRRAAFRTVADTIGCACFMHS